MIALDFLQEMTWEDRWLDAVAEGPLDLPAYTGSTVRGALGTVIRPELCARKGQYGEVCGEVCGEPERCPFYSLFEQSRAANGQGGNIPKPMLLEAPLMAGLRAIAAGATVQEPFVISPGRPLAELRNDRRIGVPDGTRFTIGLRALGAAAAALDGVAEAVRQKGLAVKGGHVRLLGVRSERASFANMQLEGAGARRLRLVLATPLLIRAKTGICQEPVALGKAVLDQALVRAVTLYNTFFAKSGAKLPFVEPGFPGVSLTSHRLFTYKLERQSYRQGRWMNFDGVVGWLEWEGQIQQIAPWLRAAEILHIGQKATFGLGKVEISEME